MKNTQNFDAIVVGAGHAGVETSLSIARAGYQVALVTMDAKTIAKMSCNPAIGGLAKGHIVREIDALGGEMAKAIDATGIQFRMLNRSKGPAVWAPRAQADKQKYHLYMKRIIEVEKNIELIEAQVTELLVQNNLCYGVQTQEGDKILGTAVILTTGTFLQGLIHVGENHYPGGRTGEKPALGLSDSLRKNGIELVRFKTGTPPRLRDKSINWSVLEKQKGDNPPQPFSYHTKELKVKQWPCFITYTNENTHRIIRENLHRSPLYAGRIEGVGPRYCPSIEDKIVKFADKTRHQLYLEPEGAETEEIYVNGASTSLPEDVQHDLIRSITGLENVEFIRPGYAIEYDCAPPTQVDHTLETKKIKNLYLAGQINCTSGYEEAAGQGLIAGLNILRRLKKKSPFMLTRAEAYLGVLIDDLVTRGTSEPYRMLTSRAEFRLLLRQDNADERLMKYGYEFGLISSEMFEQSTQKAKKIQTEIKRLKKTYVGNISLEQFLKRPETRYEHLVGEHLERSDLREDEILRVETEVKYEGYISRQRLEVERVKRLENKGIPHQVDFEKIRGISKEAAEKLSKIRPTSIGQASRIPGVSTCDLSLIAVYLSRGINS